MPMTPQQIAEFRQDTRNKKNQDRMETELYGQPVTTPVKPAKKKETPVKYRKGGYVSAADGCAKKGKTKGRIL
jgi:hypothetical protein